MRESALQRVDNDYYDPISPHHGDNERYEWAVRTINEQFDNYEKQNQNNAENN